MTAGDDIESALSALEARMQRLSDAAAEAKRDEITAAAAAAEAKERVAQAEAAATEARMAEAEAEAERSEAQRAAEAEKQREASSSALYAAMEQLESEMASVSPPPGTDEADSSYADAGDANGGGVSGGGSDGLAEPTTGASSDTTDAARSYRSSSKLRSNSLRELESLALEARSYIQGVRAQLERLQGNVGERLKLEATAAVQIADFVIRRALLDTGRALGAAGASVAGALGAAPPASPLRASGTRTSTYNGSGRLSRQQPAGDER